MNKTRLLRACNFCIRDTECRKLYTKNGYIIVQCLQCSLVYVNQLPSRFKLDRIYSEDFFKIGAKFSCEPTSAMMTNAQQRLRRLLNIVKPGLGKWLDVGCATGDFILASRPYVKEVHGIEISQYAANLMRQKGLQNVSTGDFIEVKLPDNEFDVVTMWDVIEHLCDPMSNMKKAFQIIKPGGYLVITTGDFSSLMARLTGRYWHLMIPPKHLYFFSNTTIRGMLQTVGFDIIDIQYPGKLVPLDFIFWKLSRITVNSVNKKVLRWVTQAKLGRFAPYVNFKDIMTIYARKPIK